MIEIKLLNIIGGSKRLYGGEENLCLLVISLIEPDAGYKDAITVGNFTQLYDLFTFFIYMSFFLSKSLKQTQLPGM